MAESGLNLSIPNPLPFTVSLPHLKGEPCLLILLPKTERDKAAFTEITECFITNFSRDPTPSLTLALMTTGPHLSSLSYQTVVPKLNMSSDEDPQNSHGTRTSVCCLPQVVNTSTMGVFERKDIFFLQERSGMSEVPC